MSALNDFDPKWFNFWLYKGQILPFGTGHRRTGEH